VSQFLGNGLWGLRFADAGRGYAYGNGLWQTSNGGASWRQGGGPARFVLALEAVQDRELVAIAGPCLPGQSHCRNNLGLYRRPIASGAWTRIAAARTVPFEASIAVHGAAVWALAGNRLYVSRDGGTSFGVHPQPCLPSNPRNGMPSSVSDAGPHTYLLCAGTGAAGSAEKFVFRIGGSESQWTRVGSPSRVGDPEEISAGSDQTVMISATSGASELYRSTDAGANWHTALTQRDGGAGWADLGFTTPSDGVVVHGPAVTNGSNDGRPGQLLLTDDGGRTWQRASF
jgi:photosystem II stability/assembly factor-like uncharacterized protein